MIHKFLYHTDSDLRRESEQTIACVREIIQARREHSKRWATGDLSDRVQEWNTELDSIRNDDWGTILLRERGKYIDWDSFPCAKGKLDRIKNLQNDISDTIAMPLTNYDDSEVLGTMWDLLEHTSGAVNAILMLDEHRETIGDPEHKAV